MSRNSLVWILALAIGAVSSTGCSFGEIYLNDPLLREVALAEQQKHYSALIRWSAFNKAVRYVQDEERDAFLKDAPSLKEFRFSDYESEPLSIDDTGECTVEVVYYGYRTNSPYEVEVRETQHWKRNGITNDWQVSSVFAGLDEARGRAAAR
jgi:hypothetical protein